MSSQQQASTMNTSSQDIRLFIPLFLLRKLELHPLTKDLYPVSLGKAAVVNSSQLKQENANHYLLFYCQLGQAQMTINNQVQKINQGDIVIIEPKQGYELTSPIQTTAAKKQSSENLVYWVQFNGDNAGLFSERLTMKMDDGYAHVGSFNNIFDDLDNLLALGQRGYTATNVIHAVHVLQQALSFLALQLRVSNFNNSSKFDLDSVETMMRNNLHQELSLDTLAHYAQLSKFHFAKKFKELTDTSPIQHFINMKIQKACVELDNSNASIKDIAESLGYADPYYFSRLFKKIVGLSPKQYRQSRYS